MFLGSNPELVVENVVQDFRHVIPVRDDIVRDEILQCQDTALVLHLVTNTTVFLVHANHDAWHVGGSRQTRHSKRSDSSKRVQPWRPTSGCRPGSRKEATPEPNALGKRSRLSLALQWSPFRRWQPALLRQEQPLLLAPDESSPARCTCTSLRSCMHGEPERNHPQ